MRRYPTAPVNVARISVATSGTDFTEFEADFAALIPTACFCPGDHVCYWHHRSWDACRLAANQRFIDICAFASFGLIMRP